MTTDELATYYANLLILQYVNKPKAFATVKATVTPFIMDQIPIAVQNAFSVEGAVGVQLDVIGKYVGASRVGYTLNGPVSLNDADYRQLIKLLIIKNNSGSSLYTIQSLLAANFPNQIVVSDNQAMGLNYVLSEALGSADLLEILVSGDYLPKPMGVGVSVVVLPDITYPFFGFRTYLASDDTVSPFNNYGFINTHSPWLSYSEV